MFKSFFFVPANNEKYIQKAINLSADALVFDLEDSIGNHEIDTAILNLAAIKIKHNYFVRLRFFDGTGKIDIKRINKLISIGFRNFTIPKFEDDSQIELISKAFEQNSLYSYSDFSFILIVEHPLGLINLHSTISKKRINITACAFGSHDYCNYTGMKHELENIDMVRKSILNIAKANNLEALDIVSIDLEDDEKFCEEALNGFELGYDGKFLIHPKQLNLLENIKYYSDEEVAEASYVYKKIIEIQQEKAAVVMINNKVYEKPHINRIFKIIKWSQQYGSK